MSDVPELPSITVIGGPMDSYEMKIQPGTTVIIGSGRLAHLRLDHPEIELAHVKIAWDDQGISMIDNGSRRGTWVNGEAVETLLLIDGDTIEFAPHGSKSAPPTVRIRIPKGSVPDPPPPPPPAPGDVVRPAAPAAAPARASAKGRPTRRRRSAMRIPNLRLLALVGAAIAVVATAGWGAKRLFFTAPQIDSIQPAQGEPGQTVTLTGRRFRRNAEENVVWFGDRSSNASSISGGSLQVKVPPGTRPGKLGVTVETSAGRSRPASFLAWAPLRTYTLDPPGALPGDEVVLTGSGFDEATSVTVGGKVAEVKSVEPGTLRFSMPALSGTPGSVHDVVASAGARRTRSLAMHLGRVPLVASIEPARGVAGTLVRLRGAGFAATAGRNAVTFDDAPALVVAASATELVVVAPPGRLAQPETLVPVVVRAAGKASSDGATFALQRLVEGAWVPRFLAGAVGEGGREDQATVGTEIAPVILLSGKDDARSVGERALRVAAALNAAVDRVRVGQTATFEAREQPWIGVALAGVPDLLVRATAEDAAAYDAPAGLPPRGGPPTALALARHWAAVLTDTVTVGTSAGKPAAVAAEVPAAGAAFAQLRAALPFQYGSGLASSRVAMLPADLKRRLRDVAYRVP